MFTNLLLFVNNFSLAQIDEKLKQIIGDCPIFLLGVDDEFDTSTSRKPFWDSFSMMLCLEKLDQLLFRWLL